jgi:hypothetical protein
MDIVELRKRKQSLSQRLADVEETVGDHSGATSKLFSITSELFTLAEVLGTKLDAIDNKTDTCFAMLLDAARESQSWDEFQKKCEIIFELMAHQNRSK